MPGPSEGGNRFRRPRLKNSDILKLFDLRKIVTGMENRMKKLAAVLVCAGMLGSTPAMATGIPVFDGAAATNAIQQLMNWKARFDSVTRGVLDKIDGVKTMISPNESSQVARMFDRRRKKCRQIQLKNSASGTLCLQITNLEHEKYKLLVRIDKEINNDFQRINGLAASQGGIASKIGSIGGISGMPGFSFSNQAGKAETAENNVQIQLNVVTAKYNQYKNQIEALDSQIESYNSMRKQLTKEQLSGSSLSKNINRGASIAKLTEATQRFKRKAQAEVGERSEIENKIRPILK